MPEEHTNSMSRAEHCCLAILNEDGKCTAYCEHNRLWNGFYIDCMGIKSETMEQYSDRLNAERKLH